MNTLFESSVAERLGWMLFHSLWQFAAIAVLLWFVLKALQHCGPGMRYSAQCFGILSMVAAACVTFGVTKTDSSIRERAAMQHRVAANANLPVSSAIDSTASDSGFPLQDVSQVFVFNAERDQLSEPSIDKRQVITVPASLTESEIDGLSRWRGAMLATVSPWLSTMMSVWLIGVTVLSVRPLAGWRSVRRLRRIGISDAPESATEIVRRVSSQMGVSRAIKVVESALVEVPTVIGWFQPLILLPASALTGLSCEQLQAVIAHELAHIRRCDYLVNAIQVLLETIFFYHPAVWWVSQSMRIERERCCDEVAVGLTGKRIEYAKLLLRLEESRGAANVVHPALSATGGSLIQRIKCLTDPRPARNSGGGFYLTALFVFVFVGCGLWIATSGDLSQLAIAEDQSNFAWQDLNDASCSMNDDQVLMSFHTDQQLVAVIIAQLPKQRVSERMNSSGSQTHHSYHWNWGEKRLGVRLNRADQDQLHLNSQRVSLKDGRVIYWDGDTGMIDQRTTLRDAPLALKTSFPTKQQREQFEALLERIRKEFSIQLQRDRYSFPDSPQKSDDWKARRLFTDARDLMEQATSNSAALKPEERKHIRESLTQLVVECADDPLGIYAARRLVILDWQTGEISPAVASSRLKQLADSKDETENNLTRAMALTIEARAHDPEAFQNSFGSLNPSQTPPLERKQPLKTTAKVAGTLRNSEKLSGEWLGTYGNATVHLSFAGDKIRWQLNDGRITTASEFRSVTSPSGSMELWYDYVPEIGPDAGKPRSEQLGILSDGEGSTLRVRVMPNGNRFKQPVDIIAHKLLDSASTTFFPGLKGTPGSVWFQSADQIHIVICNRGFLQSGMTYSQRGISPLKPHRIWDFSGGLNVRPGWDSKLPMRHLPIEFEYHTHDGLSLKLDGRGYDLADGRLFLVSADGQLTQHEVTLPMRSTGDETRKAWVESILQKFDHQGTAVGKESPTPMEQTLQTETFLKALAADSIFGANSEQHAGQKQSIANWQSALEFGQLSREQQVFAWWRIGSLAAYNFEVARGESHDVALAAKAMEQVHVIGGDLISLETLNAATVYGSLAGAPVERACRMASSYRWLFTRTDAMIAKSVSQINGNAHCIDDTLRPGGMYLDSAAKKREFLEQELARARERFTRRMTEEIKYSQNPDAIHSLLESISEIAEKTQMREWKALAANIQSGPFDAKAAEEQKSFDKQAPVVETNDYRSGKSDQSSGAAAQFAGFPELATDEQVGKSWGIAKLIPRYSWASDNCRTMGTEFLSAWKKARDSVPPSVHPDLDRYVARRIYELQKNLDNDQYLTAEMKDAIVTLQFHNNARSLLRLVDHRWPDEESWRHNLDAYDELLSNFIDRLNAKSDSIPDWAIRNLVTTAIGILDDFRLDFFRPHGHHILTENDRQALKAILDQCVAETESLFASRRGSSSEDASSRPILQNRSGMFGPIANSMFGAIHNYMNSVTTDVIEENDLSREFTETHKAMMTALTTDFNARQKREWNARQDWISDRFVDDERNSYLELPFESPAKQNKTPSSTLSSVTPAVAPQDDAKAVQGRTDKTDEPSTYSLAQSPDGLGYIVVETKAVVDPGKSEPVGVPTILGEPSVIQELNGTWQVDALYHGKEQVMDRMTEKPLFVMQGARGYVQWTKGTGDENGVFLFFAHPKIAGAMMVAQQGDAATYLGQYELNGESLRISLSPVPAGNVLPRLKPTEGIRFYECTRLQPQAAGHNELETALGANSNVLAPPQSTDHESAGETLAPIKVAAQRLVQAAGTPTWQLQSVDVQPSLEMDGFRFHRVTLRRTWKHHTNPPQQRAEPREDSGPFELRHEDWQFVLVPTDPKNVPAELKSKIPWAKSDSPYHTRDVCMGEGLGFVWLTRGTLFGQESLRDKLKLKGGDDRIDLLIDGMQVDDAGTMTANSCKSLIARFGDAAIPAIAKAIEELRDRDRAWKIAGSLGNIQTDKATALLVRLYQSEEEAIRNAAAYALIHQPYRANAKETYLEMLRRHERVYEVCRACVSFDWNVAVPVLTDLIARPANLRELSFTIPARRELMGRPIPQELLDAKQKIIAAGYHADHEIDQPRKLLLESDDSEATLLIAIELATFTSKGVSSRPRDVGIDLLKSLPRQSTVGYLKALLDAMPEESRRHVEQLLHSITTPIP